MRIAVTGANGFVGRAICGSLAAHGHEVVGIVRGPCAPQTCSHPDWSIATIADFSDRVALAQVMRGAQGVVHAAGLAAISGGAEAVRSKSREGRELVANVSHAAVRAGVERFVLISSIKAVAGHTQGTPITEATKPRPIDTYGMAKLEEESVVRQAHGLAVQIVRPPLLYGPGMKGNMLRLFHAAARRVPLPLGRAANKRDLLFVDTLGDVVAACLRRPHDLLPLVLARDGQALSTAELYRQIAKALGVKARFLPVPAGLVARTLRRLGRDGLAESLYGSLEIDDSATRQALAWAPAIDVRAAMAATAAWYRERRAS